MHLKIRSLPDKFDNLELRLAQIDNINVNIFYLNMCSH